jgi:hypothetical protein
MKFRHKSEAEVASDALRMAERKQAEGCNPCADGYRQLARRSLLRAGGLAAGALAVSLVDVGAISAAPGTARPDVEATDAHALAARVTHPDVRQLRALFGPTRPSAAFRATKASGAVLLEDTPEGATLVSVMAGGEVHAGLVTDDAIYVVERGQVVEAKEATRRYRDAKRHGHSSATLAGLLQPIPVSAACPICNGMLGACAIAIVACGRGCGPCCATAAAVCLFALNCCFNQ